MTLTCDLPDVALNDAVFGGNLDRRPSRSWRADHDDRLRTNRADATHQASPHTRIARVEYSIRGSPVAFPHRRRPPQRV